MMNLPFQCGVWDNKYLIIIQYDKINPNNFPLTEDGNIIIKLNDSRSKSAVLFLYYISNRYVFKVKPNIIIKWRK